MQFGRYEEDETKIRESLPHEWLEEFTRILNEAYADTLNKSGRFFDVYGEIYDKDFVVIVSYIDNKDPMKAKQLEKGIQQLKDKLWEMLN